MKDPVRFFLLVPANLLALALAWLGLQTLEGNLLGWLLLVMGIGYLAGSLIFFSPRVSPLLGGTDGHVRRMEPGDRSFWWILPGFSLAFFSAPLEYLYLGGAARASFPFQAAGLALILVAILLRAWTRQALREQYTGHVQVRTDHILETGGPYHYVRHPGYSGFFILSLGIAVGYASLLSAAAAFFVLLPGLVYRMRVEERLLTQQFGDAYRQYAGRTRRLFPWLY